MPKFQVTVREVKERTVEVEAADEGDAVFLVLNCGGRIVDEVPIESRILEVA